MKARHPVGDMTPRYRWRHNNTTLKNYKFDYTTLTKLIKYFSVVLKMILIKMIKDK